MGKVRAARVAEAIESGGDPGVVDYARALRATRLHAVHYWKERGHVHMAFSDGSRTYVASFSARHIAAIRRAGSFHVYDFDRDPFVTPVRAKGLTNRRLVQSRWMRSRWPDDPSG